MIVRFLFFFLAFGFALGIHAQNEVDALRYMQSYFGGSARASGMAGSFTALGTDPSSITVNPASLGRTSSSVFMITPLVQSVRNTSTFAGLESKTNDIASKLQGLSLVLNSPKFDKNGWKTVQTSFSYNRIAEFGATRYFQGQTYGSLLDVFASQGFGYSTSELPTFLPLTTNLAWETFAIDDQFISGGLTEYIPRLDVADSVILQRNIQAKGGIAEYSFGLSGNYNNKFYLGASVNIQRIKYIEENTHSEEVVSPGATSLRSFDYFFYLDSRAVGINAKLGLIYILSEEFRLGLSYHTPTSLRFSEKFSADMTSYHDIGPIAYTGEPAQGTFRYGFTNPSRLVGSIAYIFDSRMAFNGDFEYVNYQTGQFRSSSELVYRYNFLTENANIEKQFRPVVNTRLGMEYSVNSRQYLRFGYALYPRAYSKDHINETSSTQFFTTGFGFRMKQIQIDLAYMFGTQNSEYYPFDPGNPGNKVSRADQTHSFLISLTSRF